VTDRFVPQDVILIDQEVYEHLGPIHRMTADILIEKGKCRIVREAAA